MNSYILFNYYILVVDYPALISMEYTPLYKSFITEILIIRFALYDRSMPVNYRSK